MYIPFGCVCCRCVLNHLHEEAIGVAQDDGNGVLPAEVVISIGVPPVVTMGACWPS